MDLVLKYIIMFIVLILVILPSSFIMGKKFKWYYGAIIGGIIGFTMFSLHNLLGW